MTRGVVYTVLPVHVAILPDWIVRCEKHAEGAIRLRSLFASPPYEKRLSMPKGYVGKAEGAFRRMVIVAIM
jgi:hypothetical protein